MTSSPLPSRLTERTFRQYEPFIARAVSIAPNNLVIAVPPNLSVNTFVGRLRDSMISFSEFTWPSDIDHSRFQHLRTTKQLQVSTEVRDGQAYVFLGGGGLEILWDSSLAKLSGLIVTVDKMEVAKSVFILVIHKVLTPPVRFVQTSLMADLVDNAEAFNLPYETIDNDFILL